jgi:hypothetical protein
MPLTGLPARLRLSVAFALAVAWSVAAADTYSCTDAKGNRYTRDRRIVECNDRPQEVRGPSGVVIRIEQPTRTSDEEAAEEAKKAELLRVLAVQRENQRADQNLMKRFPSLAAHTNKRQAELDGWLQSLERARGRTSLLAKERKPLDDEAEFYAGRQMPALLRRQLDANDAAVQAQRDIVQRAQDEIARINARYDVELERLRLLWAGAAQPGALGALPVPLPASAPRRAAANTSSK